MSTLPKKIKLLQKITQKQLQFGLVIVLLSLVILYALTRYYIKDEAEESLYSTAYRIEKLLKDNQPITSLKPLYEIKEVNELKAQTIKDTLIFDEEQNENEVFRELNTYKTIHGKTYHIITRTLFAEFDQTLISILISFAFIISLVYMAQHVYNKSINKKLWLPFFENLKAIKAFSLQSKQPIKLQESEVIEFNELNHHIKALTQKVTSDYQNLKQFTEDLSHEVQTPLSIIQLKIENLINNKDLDNDTHLVINDIQKNAKRLSKLNQGLILLTKIENSQFNNTDRIEINSLTSSILHHFEDIISIKQLNIHYNDSKPVLIDIDKVLADILFSNLIGNALKYTPTKGTISITISKGAFKIYNSGSKAITNHSQLFQRFYKVDKNSQSLGLGLAIVKKISDHYDFNVQYIYQDNKHQFSLLFG